MELHNFTANFEIPSAPLSSILYDSSLKWMTQLTSSRNDEKSISSISGNGGYVPENGEDSKCSKNSFSVNSILLEILEISKKIKNMLANCKLMGTIMEGKTLVFFVTSDNSDTLTRL